MTTLVNVPESAASRNKSGTITSGTEVRVFGSSGAAVFGWSDEERDKDFLGKEDLFGIVRADIYCTSGQIEIRFDAPSDGVFPVTAGAAESVVLASQSQPYSVTTPRECSWLRVAASGGNAGVRIVAYTRA